MQTTIAHPANFFGDLDGRARGRAPNLVDRRRLVLGNPPKSTGLCEFSDSGRPGIVTRAAGMRLACQEAVSRIDALSRAIQSPGPARRVVELETLLASIPRPAAVEPLEVAVESPKRSFTIPIVLTCTAMLVAAVCLAGRRAVEDPAVVEKRVERDIEVLAGLVERYHVEAHRYPDAAAWRISVGREDRRFFDPWHRPYLYRLDADTFTIGSYGADGEPGGTGIDRDVERSFPIRQIAASKKTTKDSHLD